MTLAEKIYLEYLSTAPSNVPATTLAEAALSHAHAFEQAQKNFVPRKTSEVPVELKEVLDQIFGKQS